MSAAIRAKTAKARATLAARMLKACKPGDDLGRAFDDCFEMGDGEAVLSDLWKRAETDEALREAMAVLLK